MLGDYIDFRILNRGIPNISPAVTHRCSDWSLILGQHSHPLKDGRQRSERSACNCNGRSTLASYKTGTLSLANHIPSLELVHILLFTEVRFRPHPAMRHGTVRVHFTDSSLATEDLRVLLHFLPFTGRGEANVRDCYILGIFLCRLPVIPMSGTPMTPVVTCSFEESLTHEG